MAPPRELLLEEFIRSIGMTVYCAANDSVMRAIARQARADLLR